MSTERSPLVAARNRLRNVDKLLLSPTHAAEVCDLGRSTMYEAIRRGELKAIKVGSLTRIPLRALEEWIANLEGQEEAAGWPPAASETRGR